MWPTVAQNVATCVLLKQHMTTCGDLWPFCENPVLSRPRPEAGDTRAAPNVAAALPSKWRHVVLDLLLGQAGLWKGQRLPEWEGGDRKRGVGNFNIPLVKMSMESSVFSCPAFLDPTFYFVDKGGHHEGSRSESGRTAREKTPYNQCKGRSLRDSEKP